MPETPKKLEPELTIEKGSYLYDFGQNLPYSDPDVRALVQGITDRHILKTRWFDKMGFLLKTSLRPDGGKESFSDLRIPFDVPRSKVESIFRELNASGRVNIALSTERYPEGTAVDGIISGTRMDLSQF